MTEFSRIEPALRQQIELNLSPQEEEARIRCAWAGFFSQYETDSALEFAV